MTRSCLCFIVCIGFVHQSEYRSSWQYSRFGVWRVSHRHIWLTVYSMSPSSRSTTFAFCVVNGSCRTADTSSNSCGDRAFCVAAEKTWNSLPSEVTLSVTLSIFTHKLKTYLFSLSFSRHVYLPIFPCWCTVTAMVLHLFTKIFDWLIDWL